MSPDERIIVLGRRLANAERLRDVYQDERHELRTQLDAALAAHVLARAAAHEGDCTYGETGGIHCPLGFPCMRCQRDAACSARDDAKDELAAALAALKLAREALVNVQHLLDDADQGPRTENSVEWRIPWTRHAVEVFSSLPDALAAIEAVLKP